MNETVMGYDVELLPDKPGSRQYYVWQFAMWAIIVYAMVIGVILGYVIVLKSGGGSGGNVTEANA